MEYLSIRNWDKWQTYRKDRGQPPWIKIHRCVMRNPEWVSLTDAERGQLVAMWLLAADQNGVIPASPELIQKLCFMESMPNIDKFMELQFISSDGAKATPKRRQYDQPKAEKRRIEKNREEQNRNNPQADCLSDNNFLKTAKKYLTLPGYTEQDFIAHCKAFNVVPGDVKKILGV